MANIAGLAEAAPTPGEYLSSLFVQVWEARRSVALAEQAMRTASVTDGLRVLAGEHLVDGRRIHNLSMNELTDIGEQALTTFLEYDGARQTREGAVEERDSLEAKLLGFAGEIIGNRIDVETLSDSSEAIRWGMNLSAGGRSNQVARASGAILSRPPLHVLEERLELAPVTFPRAVIGGTYIVEPLDDQGRPQVAFTVEG